MARCSAEDWRRGATVTRADAERLIMEQFGLDASSWPDEYTCLTTIDGVGYDVNSDAAKEAAKEADNE